MNSNLFRGDPLTSPQVALWRLDKDGRHVDKPVGGSPNVRAVAGVALLEVAEILEKCYSWNAEEAHDAALREGFETVIEQADERHQVSRIPKIDGRAIFIRISGAQSRWQFPHRFPKV